MTMTYDEYARRIRQIRPRGNHSPESSIWTAFWQENIRLSQEVLSYEIGEVRYPRIPYGKETEDWGVGTHPCHDCGVKKKQLHVPGCDVERCPKCFEQAISCDCDDEEEEGELA